MEGQQNQLRANIIVIDDNASMRALVCRMLQRMDLGKVVDHGDAATAIKFMQNSPGQIDMIICDWEMPEMSGLDFLKLVRTKLPKMPFLMLTGRADLASVKAAAAAGVSGYIVKPVSPQDLKAKVTFLLRSRLNERASAVEEPPGRVDSL